MFIPLHINIFKKYDKANEFFKSNRKFNFVTYSKCQRDIV